MEEDNNINLQSQLAYLDETKTQIKEAIINKGQEIADNDSFRSYVDKINNIKTGIKLFETEEEMNADEDAQEGDRAIIYREQVQSIAQDTEFQICEFPNTVILDTAFTDNIYGMFRSADESTWFDANAELSQTQFRFRWYGDSTNGEVTYTSEDGITYTRIDTLGNPIDLGTVIKSEYEWNDVFGKFIFALGCYFGGLFEYNLNVDTNTVQLYDLSTATISYSNSGSATGTLVFNDKLPDVYSVEKLKSIEHIRNSATLYLSTDNKLKLVCSNVTYDRILVNNNNEVIGLCSLGSTNEDVIIYDLDYVTLKLSNPISIKSVSFNSNSSQYVALSNIKSIPLRLNNTYHNYSLGMCQLNQTIWNCSKTSDLHIYDDMYVFVPTQLTLKSSNELLPGKIAYGKNGIVTGNVDIYDNLDLPTLDTKYMTGLYSKPDKITLNCRHNIPFGVRQIRMNMDKVGENNFSQPYTAKYTKSYSKAHSCIFEFTVDEVNNKVIYYTSEELGGLTKFETDLNLENETKTVYNIDSGEYALNGKVLDNKIFMITHVGNYSNDDGVSYAKILDLSTNTITNIGKLKDASGYLSTCVAYDPILNLIYFEISDASSARRWDLGIIDLNTNKITFKYNGSSTSGGAYVWDTDRYIFMSCPTIGLVAYEKGSTTQITTSSTSGTFTDIAYIEDDTYKYLWAKGVVSGYSKFYYSKTLKTSSSFNTLTEISNNIEITGATKFELNGVEKFLIGKDVKSTVETDIIDFKLKDSYHTTDHYVRTIVIGTNNSIRMYYNSSDSISLILNRNFEMGDLTQNLDENSFIGYCYNNSIIMPLQSNFKDNLYLPDNAPMTQEEYQEALSKANQIKGGNE